MRFATEPTTRGRRASAPGAYVIPLVAIPTVLGLAQAPARPAPQLTPVRAIGEAFSGLGQRLDFEILSRTLVIMTAASHDDFTEVVLSRTPKAVRRLQANVLRKSRPLSLSETPTDLEELLEVPSV